MANRPSHDLKDAKRLSQNYLDGGKLKMIFNSPGRSTSKVAQVLGMDATEAAVFIAESILKLNDADFCESIYQWDDNYDVYGMEKLEDHNWYVKFSITKELDAEFLEQVSFHPLLKVMNLPDGRRLEVTHHPEEKKNGK